MHCTGCRLPPWKVVWDILLSGAAETVFEINFVHTSYLIFEFLSFVLPRPRWCGARVGARALPPSTPRHQDQRAVCSVMCRCRGRGAVGCLFYFCRIFRD